MEIENKLDEDFLFYLGFTNSYFNEMKDKSEAEHCKTWLQKLCGTRCKGIDQKRNRNIYLSNLVLCMQDGTLTEPFLKSPNKTDLTDAMEVFGHLPPNVTTPDWLQELADAPDDDDEGLRDGRTYLATRTLPGGEGAFAYLAVTLADEEPRWLGGGEGAFERAMEAKFREYVPPVSEMEQILLRRKNPGERAKVLAFYDALLQNINGELDNEVPPEQNETINALVEQLGEDLKKKGQYAKFEEMEESKRRVELLILLHDRIFARRQKTAQREELLDDIEHKTMPLSFFEVSTEAEDKAELPAAMWEQAINKMPNKKNMELLFNNYPNILIEKFLDLMSNEKEEIAIRMQKRHENIAAQMKKELRKEGEKGRTRAEEGERYYQQAASVLADVKDAYKRQQDLIEKNKEKKKSNRTEQTQLYEQLRAVLYDTQRNVEEEAARGRFLTEQINAVNAQTETYQQVNDDSLNKTEAANIALMRNIKRLRAAVKQYEGRVKQIMAISGAQGNRTSAQDFYIF